MIGLGYYVEIAREGKEIGRPPRIAARCRIHHAFNKPLGQTLDRGPASVVVSFKIVGMDHKIF